MKKNNFLTLLTITLFLLVLSACTDSDKEKKHIKKRELSKETIAVGIYKTCNANPVNIRNIIEALRIDGGIVAVTLTDEDILRAELENIDVLVFPGLNNGEFNDTTNNKVIQIIQKFVVVRGKGTIGICSGIDMLTVNNECKTLSLIGIDSIKTINNKNNSGLYKFKLSDEGKNIFSELKNTENLYIDYQGGLIFDITDNSNPDLKIIAQKADEEDSIPLFLTSTIGKGKILLAVAHPESTPGMRWMFPRMVRWVVGHDLVAYDQNVMRPDYYKNEIVYSDEYKANYEKLINELKESKKENKLILFDKLQENYSWYAAETVRTFLKDKDSKIRIRAAKYLSDIEYTAAIEDIEKAIDRERNRKNREQLEIYLNVLEMMVEQNASIE